MEVSALMAEMTRRERGLAWFAELNDAPGGEEFVNAMKVLREEQGR